MTKTTFKYYLGGLELTIYAKVFPHHPATRLEPSEDAEAVIEYIYYNDGALFDPTDIYVREPGLHSDIVDLEDDIKTRAINSVYGDPDEC